MALASATIVQLIAYRFESHRAHAVGLAVMIGGVIALILADTTQTLGWLLLATVLGRIGMTLVRGRQRSDGSASPTSHPRA